MVEELKTLLSSESLLLMLMTPSMVTGILILVMVYRLISTIGKSFIATQERTAIAFEKMAVSVECLRSAAESEKTNNEDMRITLKVIVEKLDRILSESEAKNAG